MSAPLRIGLVTESHYPRLGGMEHENHWLASAFQQLPDTLIAVACSTMPEVPCDFPYPYPLYRHLSLSIFTRWLATRSVRKMIREQGINVLHGATLDGAGFRAVRLARQLGIPAAVRAHGADLQIVPEIGYGALINPDQAPKVRYVLRYADLVSVPSTHMRDAAIAAGATVDKVLVVPPGIDTAAIDRVPFEDIRARHGIARDALLIVTVGRNRPIKRLPLLLAALRLVAHEITNLRCICVGPKEELPELIHNLKLEKIVLPVGPISSVSLGIGARDGLAPDLVNLYRSADAFMSTSYQESFGLATLEALACGTPVVITRGQGAEDIVIPGVNGVVVNEQTSAGVATGLMQVLARNPDRRCIRASVAHLTWTHAAARLRRAYLGLLRNRR